MSFKSRAQEIIDATQVDPPENDEARIGGLFKDIGAVTETVDTIADLKALTNPEHGDVVRVKAHSAIGVDRGIGSGKFVFDTTPLFTVNNVGGYSHADHAFDDSFNMSTTPFTHGVGTDSQYGTNVKFRDGAVVAVRVTEQAVSTRNPKRAYEKGTTSFTARFEAENTIYDDGRGTATGSVSHLEEAYILDDNGVYIRPTFAGFSGIGIWKRVLDDQKRVSPDMYGAIPQDTILDPTPFDSADALQRSFDVLFNVYAPKGFYYTSQNLKVRRTKQYDFGAPFNTEFQNRRIRGTATGDVLGKIYTDQDIDVMTLQGASLYRSNFNIDTSQVPDHRKSAFVVDLSFNTNRMTDCSVYVQGNRDALTFNPETGTRAFKIDVSNLVNTTIEQNLYSSSNGSFGSSSIELRCNGVHTGIWATQTAGDSKPTSVNGLKFDIKRIDHFKRAVHLERSIDFLELNGNSYQTRHTLTNANKDTPAIEINGGTVYFDGFVWDIQTSADGDGFWTNQVSVKLNGGEIYLGPTAKRQFPIRYEGVQYTKNLVMPEIQDYPFVINKRNGLTGRSAFISLLQNQLAWWDKRNTFSAETYEGTGFDFSSNLVDGTQPVIADVTLSSATAAINPIQDRCTVSFGGTSDTTNDFVEFVFSASNNDLWLANGINISFEDAIPRQIQVIVVDSDGTTSDITSVGSISKQTTINLGGDLSFSTTKVIVRLIGVQGGTSYTILDMSAGVGSPTKLFPTFIHPGGGQRIYGNLRVDSITQSEPNSRPAAGSRTEGFSPQSLRGRKNFTLAEISNLNTAPQTLATGTSEGRLVLKNAYIAVTGGTTAYGSQILNIKSSAKDRILATYDIANLDTVANQPHVMEIKYPIGRIGSGGSIRLETDAAPTLGDLTFQVIVDYEDLDTVL